MTTTTASPAGLTTARIAEIRARRAQVQELTRKLAGSGDRAFRMSIPPQADDSDFLLLALCDDVEQLLAHVAVVSDGVTPLTFAALRAANVARLPLFKNRRGGPAHSQPDGSDWSLGEWCNAVLGELGEAANLIKKVHRGDLTLDEARHELAKEYADVVTYIDLLAFRTGVDLGAATAEKWDEVAARVGVPLRIADFATPKVPDAW
jgi:NTP pyrophosphatase (non-canonical NTP hydrolase)